MLGIIKKLAGRKEERALTDRERYVELVHKAAANGGDLAADNDTAAIEGLAEKLGFTLDQVAEHVTAAGQIVPLRTTADTFAAISKERKAAKVYLAEYEEETRQILNDRRTFTAQLAEDIDRSIGRMSVASAAKTELERIQRSYGFLFAPGEDGAWEREQQRNTRHLALRRGLVENDAGYVFVAELLSPVALENSSHLKFAIADGQTQEEFEEAKSILWDSREGANDGSTFEQRLEALVGAGVPADRDGKRKRGDEVNSRTLTYETGSADAIAQATPMWRIRYAVACARVATRLEKVGKDAIAEYIVARLGD